jgi:hypothetical protein
MWVERTTDDILKDFDNYLFITATLRLVLSIARNRPISDIQIHFRQWAMSTIILREEMLSTFWEV